MRYGQQPNRKQTFQDERSYKYAINEDTNEIFLVMPDKSLVPLENPYYLLLAEQMGFYTPKTPQYFKLKANQDKRFINDDDYQNAFGDGIKKIGKQVANGVKDFIEDPKQAIKNLGRELKIAKQKGATRVKSFFDDSIEISGKLLRGIKEARPLKKVAFAPQRQAFLGLVALNFQGFATRYFLRSDEDRKAIIDSWEEKWGGDRGSLEGAFNTGKDKLPLFISKRKRQDMIRKQDELADNNWANEITGVTLSLITIAVGVIQWMVTMFVNRKVRKDAEEREQELIDAQKNADNNDPVTSPIDYELEEVNRQILAIQSNPNLDQEQKDILINELRGVIPQQTWWDKNKIWVITASGGVVLLGTLAFLLYKRNQQQ
jgi:hypothetical protein